MAETLVLGANGFIGSHLVDSLAESGHRVRAFDRFGSKDPMFNPSDNIEVYPANYLNRADLEAAIKGMEYVFHFISTTTPATAEDDPTIDIETNIKMSVELFRLAAEAGVKRVIFASSGGSIYGETENTGEHSEQDQTKPISPYAIGKLAIENYLRYFNVKHGLDSVSLRIANPYGERQPKHRKQGVIPIFLENIHEGKSVAVYGDGSMVRDYIYVKDLAKMIVSMFDKPEVAEVYNLGSGKGNSINEILNVAKMITGKDPLVEYREVPSTFVNSVVLNMDRFINDFGEPALTSLEDGMRSTYKYIEESQ